LLGRLCPGYHARVRRILAPLLLGLVAAFALAAGCQDDSVYRSGDPPPSITDSGAQDGVGAGAEAAGAGGSAGASGEIDGGSD